MLDFTLRSTAILGAAWLLANLVRTASAATRHLVWQAAIIAVLATPLLTVVAPKYSVPGIAGIAELVHEVLSPVGYVGRGFSPTSFEALRGRATYGSSIQSDPDVGASRVSVPPAPPGVALMTLATLVARIGTVILALWFVMGWIVTSAKVRRATPAPPAWQVEVNALRAKLRINREVRLRLMNDTGSPLATGVWRAAILLPTSALAWSADRRRAVLLHELAHVRRGDCRGQLMVQAACALQWFNPLIWVAIRRMRAERERACDDTVLESGTRASSYATHLLEIAKEMTPRRQPSAALAMARPSELEGRLLALLAETRARVPANGSRWAVTGTVMAITGLVVGATPLAQARVDVPRRAAAYSVLTDVMARGNRPVATRSDAKDVLQQSSDPQQREQAVVALADAAEPDAIASLRRALNDSSSDVREKAALGLAFISGRAVVPALLEALAHPDSQVREKAAIGLVLRRDERAIAPLIAAMNDPDAQVREKVAIALGTSGDLRARVPLEQALTDSDQQVREKASAGLALLGSR